MVCKGEVLSAGMQLGDIGIVLFCACVQVIKPEMKAFLAELKKKAVLGIVGGSDYPKMEEQMGGAGCKSTLLTSQ